MTMIDRGAFVLYPYMDKNMRSWTVSPGRSAEMKGELSVSPNDSLWDALGQALGTAEVTVLTTDEDIQAAEREQWDDGNKERDPA